jgi:hypothetical protein
MRTIDPRRDLSENADAQQTPRLPLNLLIPSSTIVQDSKPEARTEATGQNVLRYATDLKQVPLPI